MEPSAWSPHLYASVQLTNYDFQSRLKSGDIIISMDEKKSGDAIISMVTPSACHSAQLTNYDFQSRMKSKDGIISMVTPPAPACQCTIHILYFQVR
ncbi:hypothetical protein EV363DRAFT_1406921 [Boletus edulis]|uniref:Uncharacterized protein n=1 Tax=Boletus edulis BED1 TaxID=1328754 RepID=A0AAD4GJ78_BOLED|nr:hypothetical protein EV363DRAFT_1406921 [Boletus edulis]KAF8447340.1 hypothetical protein L210DRAFT_3641300 [Boletus edulis BED1]